MSTQIQTTSAPDSVQALLMKSKSQIAMALPKHMTPDRMLRISLTELRKNPGLQKTDPLSFIGAVVQCAQIGLEPGSALGQVYLIPYGRQTQVIIGYRGLLELARRSGQISSISAHCVHRGDAFKYSLGLNPTIEHQPSEGERGDVTHAYAVARMKDGGVQFEVMSRSEIDGIRSRSKSSGSGPWVTDYPEMARKTVLRRLCKYLPMSSELASAMESEESEGDFVITNLETGESIDLKPQITQADVNTSQVDSALSEALAKIRDTGESPELVLDCDIDKLLNSDSNTKKYWIMRINKWLSEEKKNG